MINRKSKLKILFIIICVAMALCLFKNASYAKTTKITLISVISNITNPVNNTFTYQIESKEGNKANDLSTPQTFEVKFENVEPDSDGKAIVTYDIDVSQYNYSENGLYTFIVSEIDSSNKGIYPVSDDKYEVNVEVYDKLANDVAVANNALSIKDNEKKDMEFNHEPVFTYIYVKNAVRGELASTSEYFKYKLTIKGNVGDKYIITGQDEKVEFNDKVFYTENTYTVKEGEDNFVYIYLKANQEVRIGLLANDVKQIPVGTDYKLTSVESRKWTTFIDGKQTKGIDFRATLENPEENLIDIVNEKEFDVALTGVFINILPFIIIIVLALAGFIVMRKLKENDEEEDEKEQDNK